MKEISVNDFRENPFEAIGKEWMLLTAGDDKGFNTMTVSWGGLGVLWNKNVATVYLRPQRYTREFVEANENFTLTVLKQEDRDAHKICGSKSGRDIDKCEATGLKPVFLPGGVSFEQSRLTLVCRKIYVGEINPDGFLDEAIEGNYPLKDYHKVYVGEITAIYTAE